MNVYKAVALAVALASFGTGGCSIRPIPENFSGLSTYNVVNRIRCEARTAIKERTVRLLDESKDAYAKQLALKLDENPRLFAKTSFKGLPKETRDLLDKYDGTGVAFDFTFTMAEGSGASVGLGLLDPFFRGSVAASLSAGASVARSNVRNFRVTDTFRGLLNDPGLQCAGEDKPGNFAYPITGRVGVAEIVESFLDLNEVHRLQVRGDKVSLFADTMTFTTTLTAGANPKVVLSPVGRGPQITEAPFGFSASRSDIHSLIVSISLPDNPRVIRPQTSAEQRASAGVDFQIDKNRSFPFVGGRPLEVFGP